MIIRYVALVYRNEQLRLDNKRLQAQLAQTEHELDRERDTARRLEAAEHGARTELELQRARDPRRALTSLPTRPRPPRDAA